MAHGKRLGNAPYRRLMTFPQPFAGWMTSALLAIGAASVERWSGHGQRCLRPIATNGSAVSETEAMGCIEQNCARASPPSAGISRRISSRKNTRCCASTANMGPGPCSTDLAGFAFVTRGKDYSLLDHPLVQARLHLPPDQLQQRPESQMVRSLYDCPQIPVGPEGVPCRVIVATHPAEKKKSPIGVTRAGVVYELFFTHLPQQAFTARDVVELYLHRGAFEPVLSDEDQEIDPDQWCSHSAWGQECWQLVSQWVWNLRLELGHQLEPTHLRITKFAQAFPSASPHTAPSAGYAAPQVGLPWKAGRFSGQDFALQPDGTLRCPADQKLVAHEQRREADGSLRVVYGASIRRCRPCPLRERCQWQGKTTKKPRQVSVLLHPLAVGNAPLLWCDWSRRVHRHACIQFLREKSRRDPGRASHFCKPGHRVCMPFPRRARPFSALLDRATGSQCTSRDFWTGDDPTVRRPRAYCDLVRIGHRLNMRVFGKACVGPTGEPLAPMRTQLPGSSFARATQSSASSETPCCPRKRLSWAACSCT